MRKIVIFIALLLVSYFSSAQQQVSKIEAINVALNTNRNTVYNASSSILQVDTVYSLSDSRNHILLYEVVLSNGESMLLSGSKACLPILGCWNSPSNSSILSNIDSLPEGAKDFIEGYIEQLRKCFDNDTITLFHNNEWRSLQQYDASQMRQESNIVRPLLSSRWSQSYSNDGRDPIAYNYYMESINCLENRHCPAGCVAVAMAQVMNFWKFPVYQTTYLPQFDWCNMPDYLQMSSANYIIERSAISQLLKVCGEEVDMIYCSDGECKQSSAYIEDVEAALRRFGYNSDINYERRINVETDIWINKLKDNLNHGYPVIYAGHGSGGHAFVCDGYKEYNLFHFNWGWGHSYLDLWLNIDDLTPGDDNYNDNQSAIFDIHPDENSYLYYCDFDLPLWTHYNNYYNIMGNTNPPPYKCVLQTTNHLTSVPETFPDTWRTIPIGETSEYIAHKSVTLLPGFHAERGCDFSAKIVPCTICENNTDIVLTNVPSEEIQHHVEDVVPATKALSYSEGTSITENEILFPNPSSQTITYRGKDISNLNIFDPSGKSVFRWYIVSKNDNEVVINIQALPQGAYILAIKHNNGSFSTMKFIKNNIK